MIRIVFIFLAIGLMQTVSAQRTHLEMALFDLPGVVFQRITTPSDYEVAYELRIKQPIDHNNPEKGHFYQRVYLSHMGFDRPTTIITEGYGRGQNRMYELSRLLGANQIDVEHRYYGESIPKEMDYQYLNLEQATADLHHINQLFKQIYKGKWVSTGISKGGQTTIFYRYFYPDDVDVSVPYVAPLNFALEEQRIYDFLDTVGTDECRAAILQVQKRLLKERKKVLPLLKWYTKGAGLEFGYLTFEEAFEYAVLEYPFSFWQWGASCDDIPSRSASLEEVLEHFVSVSDIGFFSDRDMVGYASHYYQAGSEMGYYGYETEDFKGLLKALPMQPNPSAVFMPNKDMQMTFDGELPKKVHEWLKTNGDRFIYINGDMDTWSATAVRPTEGRDALWFFLPGKDHGAARIRNMTKAEKTAMIEKLEEWLELDIR